MGTNTHAIGCLCGYENASTDDSVSGTNSVTERFLVDITRRLGTKIEAGMGIADVIPHRVVRVGVAHGCYEVAVVEETEPIFG